MEHKKLDDFKPGFKLLCIIELVKYGVIYTSDSRTSSVRIFLECSLHFIVLFQFRFSSAQDKILLALGIIAAMWAHFRILWNLKTESETIFRSVLCFGTKPALIWRFLSSPSGRAELLRIHIGRIKWRPFSFATLVLLSVTITLL